MLHFNLYKTAFVISIINFFHFVIKYFFYICVSDIRQRWLNVFLKFSSRFNSTLTTQDKNRFLTELDFAFKSTDVNIRAITLFLKSSTGWHSTARCRIVKNSTYFNE